MQDLAWLKAQPIAHRGYHDMNKTVWENTLSAARRAVEKGFSIECDLHYTADSVPVVFHDDDLQRLCGIRGDVRAHTAGELGLLAVGGTSDKVPTLRQLLKTVDGKCRSSSSSRAGRATTKALPNRCSTSSKATRACRADELRPLAAEGPEGASRALPAWSYRGRLQPRNLLRA